MEIILSQSGENPNKDKLIVLGIEYGRWSIISMMLKLWEKDLAFGNLANVLPRETWEYLGDALGEVSFGENASKKERKAFDGLKTLVKSVEF